MTFLFLLKYGYYPSSISPSSRSCDLVRWLCSCWQRRLWRSCQLLTLWHEDHPYSARTVCLSFAAEACNHSANYLLVSTAPTNLPLVFCSPSLRLLLCSCCTLFFSTPLFHTLWRIWQELFFLSSSFTTRLQWILGHSFFPENKLFRRDALIQPFTVSCSLSL